MPYALNPLLLGAVLLLTIYLGVTQYDAWRDKWSNQVAIRLLRDAGGAARYIYGDQPLAFLERYELKMGETLQDVADKNDISLARLMSINRFLSDKLLVPKRLKTLEEWAWAYGLKILDPDGFDRKDPYLFQRLFTQEQFLGGIWLCTLETNAGSIAAGAITADKISFETITADKISPGTINL